MYNFSRVHCYGLIVLGLLAPLRSLSAHEPESSWENGAHVAAFFSAIVGGLAIAKKIVEQRSVTSTINNRIAFPLHQRFYDGQESELSEDEFREQNRDHVEKSLTSLISRTQKRLAVIGVALTIATASKSKWWSMFANNVGWIQARTEFGMSMLYYSYGQERISASLFSSPIRESLWVASTLLYTQFADIHRAKDLDEIYDFPEWVFIWLSYLYEMGRIDS